MNHNKLEGIINIKHCNSVDNKRYRFMGVVFGAVITGGAEVKE